MFTKLRITLLLLSTAFAVGLVAVPSNREASAAAQCLISDCPNCRADGNVDCWDPSPCECEWRFIT